MPVGTQVPFRLCDLYAWKLSQLDGTPYFQLFWDSSRRDDVIKSLISFLQRFREPYKYNPALPKHEWRLEANQARLSFPQLTRPATRDDFTNNRSIFWMEGKRGTKVVPLPEFPMLARWTKLKDYPYEAQTFDSKTGQSSHRTLYHQEGNVWQAEEFSEEGKTTRFYGFVGKYVVAKVPAEEIEFPRDEYGQWANLSHGLDCFLDVPSRNRDEVALRLPEWRIGKPIMISVFLHNRNGLEQNVPALLYRASPTPAFNTGITIQLSRLADESLNQELAKGKLPLMGFDRAGWSSLSSKTQTHFYSTDKIRKLGFGETYEAFSFDLTAWFELLRAGGYKVTVTFSEAAGGFAEGQSSELLFIAR